METNTNPLAAFQPQEENRLTMSDLHPPVEETTTPISNKASNVNLAAHAAMFSTNPNEVVDNYDAVVGQMGEEGKSSVSDNLISQAQQVEHEKSKDVLPTLLADNTISDKAKYDAIKNVYDANSALYHPANILASESLTQAIPSEPVEAENTRLSLSEIVNYSNSQRRAKQNILNGEMAKNNPSIVNKVLDIAQTLIPGANSYMTGKARAAVTGDVLWSYTKAFLAEGHAKQDIREALANAPVDKKIEMTQKIADIINDSQGIIASRPNDFRRIQLMQETLGQDGPDNAQVWADDAFGLMDLAFGIGSIIKGGKAVKGIADVAKGFSSAADFTGDVSKGGSSIIRDVKTYPEMKSQVEVELGKQVEAWKANKPAVSDFEAGVQASIDGSKKAKRTSTEVDYQKAVSKWNSSKPKATDVEADLKRSVDNFNRRKGPAPSGVEKSLQSEIEAFKAKQAEDVPNVVVSQVQPVSVSQVLKDTNPDRFRGMHGAMAQDETGRVAEAAYGTSRQDAIVTDLAPQVATESGAVQAKVAVADANQLKLADVDTDLSAFIKQDGALYYTDAQKLSNQSRIVNDFQQAFNVTGRKEMYQIQSKAVGESTGNGVKISATYGPQESGFHDPQSAIDAVKFALRDYGVGDESIQLLKRTGDDYIPVSKELATQEGVKGDYLVRVDHDYKFNPFKMEDYPKNMVKNNWFMRTSTLQGSSGAGSLQRHLVNITSMLEPHITLSMSKAVTKTSGVMREFVRVGTEVSKSFVKLAPQEKSVVMDMIKEGNLKGKWWSPVEMEAAGLSDKAKDTLNSWKKYWDNHFFFENQDHTRSLSNQGYMKYESGATDTNLWAKPINNVNSIPDNIRVYDSTTDSVRVMRGNEIADLYNGGGKIAELEGVEIHAGKEFQHIISKETAGEGYLRAFNQTDQTLNYRPGYFHVAYKDPHFIIKTIVNDAGKEVGTRAVATAANLKDAEAMRVRLAASDGGEYTIRGAAKNEDGRARDYRSVQRAKGRSAQRFRGERLENSTSIISDPSYSHIQDPLEAMISSARSISRRISMRDPIEAMKQGLMKQYEQFMPKVDGLHKYPNNVLDIKNVSGNSRLDKEQAAARSTYEYIQQMEGGYVNHIDDGYKAILNKIGDLLGEKSVDSGGLVSKASQVGENITRSAAGVKPTKIARSAANNFFIVTNPVRQLLVQGHQVMQIVPIAPKFFADPRSSAQVMFLISKQMGMETSESALKFLKMTRPEAEEMWSHFKLSGNYAAIDSHTMINGSLKSFVDGVTPARTIAGKIGQAAVKPVGWLRQIGFDAGENFNQTVAWAAFRHKALEEGRVMSDAATRDRVASLATNFTGNMNKAGQNAYEGNALNVGLQFMGWAHRWAGIMTGSRVFTKSEKARLWGWQLLMYGMPGGYAGYGMFQHFLPDDPHTKDQIVQGLVGATYNKIASITSGEEVKANWSASLNPLDMYGTASHLKEVMGGDIGKFFADSPAGALLFGGNPQLTNLVKDAAKWTNLSEDSKEHPTDLSNVATDFLRLFGGLSNAYKAKYAFETGKKLSTYTGKVVDTNITNTQALLIAAGIPDIDEAKTRYINGVMHDKYKELESDVQHFHDERKRLLLNDDITPDQFKYYLEMSNEFFRAHPEDNSLAQQMYKRLVDKDIEGGDTRIPKQLMQMNNIMDKEKALELANLYPDTDATKRAQYIEHINFLYSDPKKEQEK